MDTASTPATDSAFRRGHLLVFAGAFCISFAAFFVKGAAIDSSMVAFYRLLFGGLAFLAATVARRERLRPPRSVMGLILLAGALFCTDLIAWHKAIVLIGPGIATILGNFEVFYLAAFGVLFLGDRLSWAQVAAMPLALAGLALLLGLHGGALPEGTWRAVGLTQVAALCYAAYVLALRRTQTRPERLGAIPNMAWVSMAACACVGAYCLATGVSFRIPDWTTLSLLAGLGIVCQAFGWFLLSLGLPHLSPFRAGLILLTQPALSYLWDILFCGAGAGWVNVAGAVITIAAIGMGLLPGAKKKTA